MLFLASFVAYWPPQFPLLLWPIRITMLAVNAYILWITLSICPFWTMFFNSSIPQQRRILFQKHFALVEGESTRQSLFFHLIGTFGSRQQLLFQVVSSTATIKDHQITRFVNRTFCTIKIGIPLALRLLRNDTFFWPFFSTSRPF